MRAVLLDVSDHFLAERRRLGLDGRDEMWEGVLHMVPPPADHHQGLSGDLFIVLGPVATRAGLLPRIETGLFDPAVRGFHDYRVPDQMYADPSVRTERGIDGPAALVIEFRSPGDDTYEKLPYFHRLGVAEMLVVHPLSRKFELRRRTLAGWDEPAPDAAGWLQLLALPVALRTAAGPVLEVRTPGGGVERL